MLAYHLRVRLESLEVEHLTVPYSKDILLENPEKIARNKHSSLFLWRRRKALALQNVLVIFLH